MPQAVLWCEPFWQPQCAHVIVFDAIIIIIIIIVTIIIIFATFTWQHQRYERMNMTRESCEQLYRHCLSLSLALSSFSFFSLYSASQLRYQIVKCTKIRVLP